jgi:hypothetical protein
MLLPAWSAASCAGLPGLYRHITVHATSASWLLLLLHPEAAKGHHGMRLQGWPA